MTRPDHRSTLPRLRRASAEGAAPALARPIGLIGLLALFGALVAGAPHESAAEGTLLVLLDRSESMASSSKWATASLSIVQSLDADAVDALSVGLLAAPAGAVTGPACVFGTPLPCQAPAFPQIEIAAAGTQKSTAPSGVRRQIRNWLLANAPVTGMPDGFPLYAAAQSAIAALQSTPGSGPRTLLILTDGGISCGVVANPIRPGYDDCNGCSGEWDAPDNLAQLLAAARAHPTAPVETLVVGLPGSNTTGATCEEPPYSTRLALSAIAFAGSPANAQPGCTGTDFSQAGGDPLTGCHHDLSIGFSGTALSAAIADAISATLPLPVPSFRTLGVAALAALLVALGGSGFVRRSATRA